MSAVFHPTQFFGARGHDVAVTKSVAMETVCYLESDVEKLPDNTYQQKINI